MPPYIQRSLVALCVMLLSSSLILLPWAYTVTVTILDQETVKNWLSESDAYSRIAEFAAESTRSSVSDGTNALPTQDPRIKQIFHDAIKPSFSEESSGKMIDSLYNWFEGKGSTTPQFSTDIQAIKLRLADGLSNFAAQNVVSLPACTPEQLAVLSTTGIDPLNATCMPAGTNPEQVRAEVRNQILSSKEFLAINGEKTGDAVDAGAEIQKNLESIRSIYQLAQVGPVILSIIAIVAATAIALLSTVRRKGLQRIALTVISSGIVTGIASIILHNSIKTIASVDTNEFPGSILIIISGDITRILTIWSIALITCGAVGFVTTWILGRNQTVNTSTTKK